MKQLDRALVRELLVLHDRGRGREQLVLRGRRGLEDDEPA